MTSLRIYQPALIDVIEPDTAAIPGQVVRVTGGDRNDVGIATPDGSSDLGIVSKQSLVPLPKGRKLTFDPQTGYTEAALRRIC